MPIYTILKPFLKYNPETQLMLNTCHPSTCDIAHKERKLHNTKILLFRFAKKIERALRKLHYQAFFCKHFYVWMIAHNDYTIAFYFFYNKYGKSIFVFKMRVQNAYSILFYCKFTHTMLSNMPFWSHLCFFCTCLKCFGT